MSCRLLLSFFCFICFVGILSPRLLAQEKTQIVWDFDIKEDRYGNPVGKVFLKVGKQRILILKNAPWSFSVADGKSEGHDIPPKAITACFGWWAGSGAELYVIRKGRRLAVYIRYLDEQVDTSNYERLKKIPLPR